MKFFATALLLSCTFNSDLGPDILIPRGDACDEQATAWCDRVEPNAAGNGCLIVYRHWCGMGGEVSTHAQDACLDAICSMKPDPLTGWYIPDACGSTFATAPPP